MASFDWWSWQRMFLLQIVLLFEPSVGCDGLHDQVRYKAIAKHKSAKTLMKAYNYSWRCVQKLENDQCLFTDPLGAWMPYIILTLHLKLDELVYIRLPNIWAVTGRNPMTDIEWFGWFSKTNVYTCILYTCIYIYINLIIYKSMKSIHIYIYISIYTICPWYHIRPSNLQPSLPRWQPKGYGLATTCEEVQPGPFSGDMSIWIPPWWHVQNESPFKEQKPQGIYSLTFWNSCFFLLVDSRTGWTAGKPHPSHVWLVTVRVKKPARLKLWMVCFQWWVSQGPWRTATKLVTLHRDRSI